MDLKCPHHTHARAHTQRQPRGVMRVLTNLTVIISQYIHMLNHHIVLLKLA